VAGSAGKDSLREAVRFGGRLMLGTTLVMFFLTRWICDVPPVYHGFLKKKNAHTRQAFQKQ
jgi:hypothetical protein